MAHTSSCARSQKPPSRCHCQCKGALHGRRQGEAPYRTPAPWPDAGRAGGSQREWLDAADYYADEVGRWLAEDVLTGHTREELLKEIGQVLVTVCADPTLAGHVPQDRLDLGHSVCEILTAVYWAQTAFQSAMREGVEASTKALAIALWTELTGEASNNTDLARTLVASFASTVSGELADRGLQLLLTSLGLLPNLKLTTLIVWACPNLEQHPTASAAVDDALPEILITLLLPKLHTPTSG